MSIIESEILLKNNWKNGKEKQTKKTWIQKTKKKKSSKRSTMPTYSISSKVFHLILFHLY